VLQKSVITQVKRAADAVLQQPADRRLERADQDEIAAAGAVAA
jgi:hypothetical protein